MDIEKIIDLLKSNKEVTIGIIGDYCLDKYLDIDKSIDEISVETGLIAYQVTKTRIYAGAAGTVTNNLRSLGAKIKCIGVYGDDGQGYDLIKKLNEVGADTSNMIKTDLIPTPTYTKPIRDNKEMNRLDIRNHYVMPNTLIEKIKEKLALLVKEVDAILIADQFIEKDFGLITENLRNYICELARENPDLIFYADSRGFIGEYRDVLVKCNDKEVMDFALPNYSGEVNKKILVTCGKDMAKRIKKPVFITLGEKGSIIISKDTFIEVDAFTVTGDIDICGAGDSTNAGIVFGLCKGMSLEEAALIGNAVASITIKQIGITGTASIKEVIKKLESF